METTLIAATDYSFVPKSGKHTDGLGKIYNGVRGKAENLDAVCVSAKTPLTTCLPSAGDS